jgi:hypothetical protein
MHVNACTLIAVTLASILNLATPSGSSDDDADPDPWVAKSFVILGSTTSYADAKKLASAGARLLETKLDLRGLSPDKRTGLTFSRKVCEAEGELFPCYWPRGRWDDGVYISVEFSSGYKGFKPGLYIVIMANAGKDDDDIKGALKHARLHYSDAYAKTTAVYLGCVH